MRPYPDPEQHSEEYLHRRASQYAHGLQKAGLKSNDRLTRAVAERHVRDARERYVQEVTQTRDHNIAVVKRKHHEAMNDIKRKGARLRVIMCPPIALVAGL